MLTNHFVEITKHRYAVQQETEIGPSKHHILPIFDALLELLKHAADQDRETRELKETLRAYTKRP